MTNTRNNKKREREKWPDRSIFSLYCRFHSHNKKCCAYSLVTGKKRERSLQQLTGVDSLERILVAVGVVFSLWVFLPSESTDGKKLHLSAKSFTTQRWPEKNGKIKSMERTYDGKCNQNLRFPTNVPNMKVFSGLLVWQPRRNFVRRAVSSRVSIDLLIWPFLYLCVTFQRYNVSGLI